MSKNQNYNNLINKTLIKTALHGLNSLLFGKKLLCKLGTSIFKPFGQVLIKIFFKTFGLGGYKIYLFLNRNLSFLRQKSSNKLIAFVSHPYIIHVTIIAIASLVVFNNLQAQDVRQEDFGDKTMLFALINQDEIGYIIEENVDVTNKDSTSLSYAAPALSPTTQTNNTDEPQSYGTITQGGTAITKPYITGTDEGGNTGTIQTYIVKTGDTFSGLADRFGVSINTILWANNLSLSSYLKPGQSLTILPVSGVAHKIARGETLGSIAKKYGVEIDKIMNQNNLASASDLQIGASLLIPGGKKYTPAPTKIVTPTTRLTTSKNVFTPTSNGTYFWPTGCHVITQYFKWNHGGIDVGCKTGTPTYAIADGVVIVSKNGWNYGYGNYIEIDHGNGIVSLYGHHNERLVGVGDVVKKGQQIGKMGSTGRSTGPHLHLEFRINGSRKNPLNYLK